MEKNQKQTNAAQRSYQESAKTPQTPEPRSKSAGMPGSSCASQASSERTDPRGSQLEKDSRNVSQAASNEDWEGGTSRPTPTQEGQAQTVKKSPQPEIPAKENPSPRAMPPQGDPVKQNRSQQGNK